MMQAPLTALLLETPAFVWPKGYLACEIFGREGSSNIPCQFELYFLYSMTSDIGSLLATELYSVATSTTKRVVIRDIITLIARSFDVDPSPKDRVLGETHH